MKAKTSASMFVISLALILVALAVLWVAFRVLAASLAWVFGALHFIVAAIGIFSCVTSPKQKTNVKLLWILIIVLAPYVGTLLWFLWGKKNT